MHQTDIFLLFFLVYNLETYFPALFLFLQTGCKGQKLFLKKIFETNLKNIKLRKFCAFFNVSLYIDYCAANINNFDIMEPETINAEDRKRLDRQRFIGWETQKKLLSSRVLITPANGPNTQLAKNLILAGVNITLYDDVIVTEDDFQTNFLIAESDIGRRRSEAVFQKLKEMNPTGKNEVFHQNLIDNLNNHCGENFKRYTMIVTSTGNFEKAGLWDSLTRRLNIPYYNLVCCGFYSFAFISLGSQYQYKEINKKDNSVSKIYTIESLTLEESLEYKGALKNKEFIAAIAMIAKAQANGWNYDPFEPNQQLLNSIVSLGIEFAGEKHRQFLTSFAKTFNVDFCPVYSVLGSIISQEVIKIAQNQTQPGVNWLVFNSEQGYSNIVKVSTQKAKISFVVPQSV